MYFLYGNIFVEALVWPKVVLQVLSRGAIYLNTSLTESFGIAILEAACAGLYVVSTKVGGVPEILPEDMISFAKPEEEGLYIHFSLNEVFV